MRRVWPRFAPRTPQEVGRSALQFLSCTASLPVIDRNPLESSARAPTRLQIEVWFCRCPTWDAAEMRLVDS
jgi:hypothetical protein